MRRTEMQPAVTLLLAALLLASPWTAATGGAADAADRSPATIDDFSLRDYRGKQHSLSDAVRKVDGTARESAGELVVVAFLGTECPLAKLYAPRMAELHTEYGARGVTFLGINANQQDSLTEVAAHARIHGLKFPVLKDTRNEVADRLAAVRTPEAFVLQRQPEGPWVVRYRGRIDDQYGIGTARDRPQRRELAVALDELLAGKPVATPRTEAVGCHIGRIREPKTDSEVTYTRDVAPILQKRCVECHREGEIAPFALSDYDEVVGWAQMINEVVREERMPPWHASPKHGTFTDDRRMSDAEKKTIERWFRAGAPQGDPADLPAPRKFVPGWQLPQRPELVVEMRDRAFDVPAEGEVRYQYFRVDPGFAEDKWVRMAEVQPGNRAVVHHILVFVRAGRGLSRSGAEGEFLAAYVPGMRARPLPAGMAKKIPAGAELVFQLHYTPIGSAQRDLSRIGLVFADEADVTHQVLTSKALNRRFKIPPGADDHPVSADSPAAPIPVQLLAMMPHAHLRGKSFRYEAVFPDGRRQTLLDIPRYDFNWQTAYRLTEPIALPRGAKIHCAARYDNSAGNLANPDPTATVRWGDQTWEEMMIGYFDIALPRAVTDAKGESARTPRGRATRVIAGLDDNGDGQISRKETPARLRPLHERLDKNDDGQVSLEELTPFVDKLPAQ